MTTMTRATGSCVKGINLHPAILSADYIPEVAWEVKFFQLTHDIIYNIILNMVGWRNLFEKIRQNPKNVHFNDLCRLAEKFGFRFRGGKGSHRIYAQNGVFEILNFQNVGGMAKPYQVRQFLNVVDKYDLKMEE